jgi:D-proline reductase (dithiol) PrdB
MSDGEARIDYIARTRELYSELPPYRWCDLRAEPVPWTPIRIALSSARVLLISTSGVYTDEQEPFGLADDTSIRRIPTDWPTARLRANHFGYPVEYAREDPNCVFPIDRLRELVTARVIDGLTDNAITCMGGIYSQRRVRNELLPRILECADEERPDLAFLVPA